MRFTRKNRLSSKQDFDSVFAKSNKIGYKHLLARYQQNDMSDSRLGIIISKQLLKQSTSRNQHRRIIRESFRHHQEMLKGLDLIVIMRSKCIPLDKKMFRNDVDSLWELIANSKTT